MLDLTFLSEKQIFDNKKIFGNKQLNIFKKIGVKSAITDFAILSGGDVSYINFTSEGNSMKERTGYYFTETSFTINPHNIFIEPDFIIVTTDGKKNYSDFFGVGLRPAFSYSSISNLNLNEKIGKFGIKEIEYGEYPQWVDDDTHSFRLELQYSDGIIDPTGKTYTTNTKKFDEFKPQKHIEYGYNSGKYIRFVGDLNSEGEVLSNGKKVVSGEPYWIKVEPITWLVDEKTNIAISKNILLSGLKTKYDILHREEEDFKYTNIKKFMDTYLSKEIECSVIKDKLLNEEEQRQIQEFESNKVSDFDSIFEDAINKMNEINEVEKPKTLSLK